MRLNWYRSDGIEWYRRRWMVQEWTNNTGAMGLNGTGGDEWRRSKAFTSRITRQCHRAHNGKRCPGETEVKGEVFHFHLCCVLAVTQSDQTKFVQNYIFSQPNLKWWSQSCHVLAMLTNDFCLRLWDSEEQANSFREPPDRPSTCGGRLLTGFQFQRKCLSLQDVVESDLSLLCGLLCKRRRYKMPILQSITDWNLSKH